MTRGLEAMPATPGYDPELRNIIGISIPIFNDGLHIKQLMKDYWKSAEETVGDI